MAFFDTDSLVRGRHITNQWEKICGRWSFGEQIAHIHSEVSEVFDVNRNKKNKYGETGSKEWKTHLLDEIADIHLSTLTLQDMYGITPLEINDAIELKLKELQARINLVTKSQEKN